MGWARRLAVPEGGELWRKLREALASTDEDEPPHIAVALVGIGAATGRRSLGGCSHSLRQQLLRGADAVGTPLAVLDPRGASLATLWLSAAAFRAFFFFVLTRAALGQAPPRDGIGGPRRGARPPAGSLHSPPSAFA